MMRSVSVRCVSIFSYVVIGAVAISCSLGLYPPKVLVTVSASPNGRTGPALSQMAHYILSVSGPNTNSLSSSDVQGRSLDCLGLKGQVFFPLTYSQLIAGVQASLAAGNYQFTLLGFDSSAVSSPATVAQLFSGSPALKAYRLAQVSASIGKSQTLELVPGYDAATAADLLVQCPKGSYSLHAILQSSNSIYYLNNSTGSWTETLVGTSGVFNMGSLFVDANANAHVTIGTTATPTGVRYSNNTTGTFSPTVMVASPVQTASQEQSAIVLDQSNIPVVLSNFDQGGAANVIANTYIKTNAGFLSASPVFTFGYNNYYDFSMAVSASGELAAAGSANTSGAPLSVALRAVNGVWGTPRMILNAGPNFCSSGATGAQVQYDPDGFPHLIYLCNTGSATYLGHATNRSGAWTTMAVDTISVSANGGAFSIDPGGTMHLVYPNATLLYYLTGDSALSTFGTAEVIGSAVAGFDSLTIVARGNFDVWILGNAPTGFNEALTLYHKGVGGFTMTSIGTHATGARLLSRMYAQ